MCNKIIDHTSELKWRMTAMHINTRDTCEFWKLCKGEITNIRECQYCAYSTFERRGSEPCKAGFCKLHKAANKDARRELAEAKQMLESLVANIKGGIITCIFNNKTQSSKVTYINPGWTTITGYTKEELNREKGGNPLSLVLLEDQIVSDRLYLEQTAKSNEYELMYRVRRKDGVVIWVLDRGIVSRLENGNVQNQSIITEMTAIKEREETLRRMAQIDQLTSLYNKVTTAFLAQTVLENLPHKQHAVFMVDVDGFKHINDSMGHAFGDIVLEEVAACLKHIFRSGDILGRLGGDEFGILMTDISPAVVERKAEGICETVRRIRIGTGVHPVITVSLGVAFSKEKTDWQDIYIRADSALYEAKNKGKNQYCISRE